MGGALSQGGACGTLSLASTGMSSVDELEVRHQNKGVDPYAAPVQLFKGRPPSAAPTLDDADRIPVDLRPQSDDAPWQKRQPRQRQGWDRKPWAPEANNVGLSINVPHAHHASAGVGAGAPGGVRKPMRRTRGNDLVLPALDAPGSRDGDGDAAPDAARHEAEAEAAAAPHRSAAALAREERLRDLLHGWRTVAAFSTGRILPARRAADADAGGGGGSGARRERSRGTGKSSRGVATDNESDAHRDGWRATIGAFRDGRRSAVTTDRDSNSGDEDEDDGAPAAAGGTAVGDGGDDTAAWGDDGYGKGAAANPAAPWLRAAPPPPPPPPELRLLSRGARAVLMLAPAACAAALLLCALAAACLAACQDAAARRLDASFDAAWRGSGAATPLFAAAWEGHAAEVSSALATAAARGGGAAAALLSASVATHGGAVVRARASCVGAAAAAGRSGAVRALLAVPAGAAEARRPGRSLHPSAARHWPLGDAARHPRGAAVVTALLDAGARPGVGRGLGPASLLAHTAPLADAAGRGDVEALNALLAGGADVRRHGTQLGAFGALATASPLWSLLHTAPPADAASAAGALDALLAAGAPVRRGATLGPLGVVAHESPLSAAARAGSGAAVARLLAAGAPGAEGVRAGPAALLGAASPLAVAAAYGNAGAASALLAASAASSSSAASPAAPPCTGAQLGLRGALATASPLFLALAAAPHDAQARTLDALLSAPHACDLNAGLRIGPWGLLAHVTPLGAAAAAGDALAVSRLLAAGADATRCVRVLRLRLRCVPTVARGAAVAAFGDGVAQRAAHVAAEERAALSAAEEARAAGQAAAAADAARRLAEAERVSAASLAAAERTLAAAERRRAAADAGQARVPHADTLAAADAAAADAAAAAAAARLAALTPLHGASALPQPSFGDNDADALSDAELAALEAWLAAQAADADAAVWGGA
jgi:hypothetical protein